MSFLEDARQYTPATGRERAEQRVLLEWAERFPDSILYRENTLAHMTFSAMIFDPAMQQTLMVFHNLYRSWSWTGGHADGDPDGLAVARREAEEESGICGLVPLCTRPTGLDILPVTGHAKRGVWVPAHLHLNLCYSFWADPALPLHSRPEENSGARWLPLVQLEHFVSEPAMLPIYRRIVQRSRQLCAKSN